MTIPLPRASLRTYLLALTAGVVIPVLCFAAYLIIGLSRLQQEAVERGLTETVRALASGVDRELMSSITAHVRHVSELPVPVTADIPL